MRALMQPNPREWFTVKAGRAPYMQPGAYAQRRKSLMRQLRLMHFGQVDDRYRPGAAQILERAPVPGSFYRPRTGIAPYDVARVAYGPEQDRIKAGLLMMNRATWNDHIRRAKTGWTAYKVEGLQFDHKYNAADPLSTYGSGTSYPVVWVPPIDGREPEEFFAPAAAPAPVVAAPPPKPVVPPPIVIRMPTMPVVVKRPPPMIIKPPPPPVVVKQAPKPAAPAPVVTAPPVVAERPPISLPEIVISLPKKKGKESGLLPPEIVHRAPEPPAPEPIGPPEYPGEKKKSSALPLLAIALIASQVL